MEEANFFIFTLEEFISDSRGNGKAKQINFILNRRIIHSYERVLALIFFASTLVSKLCNDKRRSFELWKQNLSELFCSGNVIKINILIICCRLYSLCLITWFWSNFYINFSGHFKHQKKKKNYKLDNHCTHGKNIIIHKGFQKHLLLFSHPIDFSNH